VFITSCGVEVTTGSWSATYLVQSKGLAVDDAARLVMLFYFGFSLGRLISGLLSSKLTSWQLICYSQAIMAAAIIAMLLPLGAIGFGICLFLVGLGCGPVFPNMTYLTPIHFGPGVCQSFIGLQMAMSYSAFLLTPILFSVLARVVGVWLFPVVCAAAMLLTALSTAAMARRTREVRP